jgi:hypothetical protein
MKKLYAEVRVFGTKDEWFFKSGEFKTKKEMLAYMGNMGMSVKNNKVYTIEEMHDKGWEV